MPTQLNDRKYDGTPALPMQLEAEVEHSLGIKTLIAVDAHGICWMNMGRNSPLEKVSFAQVKYICESELQYALALRVREACSAPPAPDAAWMTHARAAGWRPPEAAKTLQKTPGVTASQRASKEGDASPTDRQSSSPRPGLR